MTVIETYIDTLEKLIPEIVLSMDLYLYEEKSLQSALNALRDKVKTDARLIEAENTISKLRSLLAIHGLHLS